MLIWLLYDQSGAYAEVAALNNSTAAVYSSQEISIIRNMNGDTDYLEFYVWIDINTTLNGGLQYNEFSAVRISD